MKKENHVTAMTDWVKLYHAVNKMLLVLGADGEINSTQDEVCDIFAALEPLDGGQYNHEMKA